MSAFRVVGQRVDALTLAFRVQIADDVKAKLVERHEVAKEHGRAAIVVGALRGELRFTRSGSCWNVANRDVRVRIDLKAPGAVEHEDGAREPGWTVEVVWYAQALAELVHVGDAIDVTRRLVDTLGHVYEERVRRVDLCADVAGWKLDPEQASRIVKRPRAKMSEHPFEEDEGRAAVTLHERRRITGFTVCPGGALLGRIYDKRQELEIKEEHREAEQARWTAGGWDGEAPVTRVEFQVRGEAIRDLGARNPREPFDPVTGEVFGGLHEVIDRIWQRCLWWMRLVKRDAERPTRCSDDPRWALLRHVTFVRKTRVEHGRKRIRGGASAEQALGCALSVLAARARLPALAWSEEEVRGHETIVAAALGEEVRGLFVDASALVTDRLLKKWGAARGAKHLAVLVNATRERFDGHVVETEAARQVAA